MRSSVVSVFFTQEFFQGFPVDSSIPAHFTKYLGPFSARISTTSHSSPSPCGLNCVWEGSRSGEEADSTSDMACGSSEEVAGRSEDGGQCQGSIGCRALQPWLGLGAPLPPSCRQHAEARTSAQTCTSEWLKRVSAASHPQLCWSSNRIV